MIYLLQLLKKIKPITPKQLTGKSLWLLGSGSYAHKIINSWQPKVLGFISDSHSFNNTISKKYPTVEPSEAEGDILLASGVYAYRLQQLMTLSGYVRFSC